MTGSDNRLALGGGLFQKTQEEMSQAAQDAAVHQELFMDTDQDCGGEEDKEMFALAELEELRGRVREYEGRLDQMSQEHRAALIKVEEGRRKEEEVRRKECEERRKEGLEFQQRLQRLSVPAGREAELRKQLVGGSGVCSEQVVNIVITVSNEGCLLCVQYSIRRFCGSRWSMSCVARWRRTAPCFPPWR